MGGKGEGGEGGGRGKQSSYLPLLVKRNPTLTNFSLPFSRFCLLILRSYTRTCFPFIPPFPPFCPLPATAFLLSFFQPFNRVLPALPCFSLLISSFQSIRHSPSSSFSPFTPAAVVPLSSSLLPFPYCHLLLFLIFCHISPHCCSIPLSLPPLPLRFAFFYPLFPSLTSCYPLFLTNYLLFLLSFLYCSTYSLPITIPSSCLLPPATPSLNHSLFLPYLPFPPLPPPPTPFSHPSPSV